MKVISDPTPFLTFSFIVFLCHSLPRSAISRIMKRQFRDVQPALSFSTRETVICLDFTASDH
ncbi:unnamed protein product [Darwinula stevensoni]|uniref:Uncharacterized protein n=1 Tax=Darwinula stevensoni TaxID=69355 RepID=A0A7R8X2A4_9CRUS|nr:unnamed protein product [Darwinula stevensoni]CAG0883692.1 unnamed protein product [Darwinula stevensoni]